MTPARTETKKSAAVASTATVMRTLSGLKYSSMKASMVMLSCFRWALWEFSGLGTLR